MCLCHFKQPEQGLGVKAQPGPTSLKPSTSKLKHYFFSAKGGEQKICDLTS